MFDYIEGEVAFHGATRLVVAVGGIGYELSVPLGAVFSGGARARVWTHLVVREDAHTLYGFPDAATRDLFRALLTVNGVGPRTALGALSGLSRLELIEAIAAGDRARLTALKGLGKKTADQILLDLSERAGQMLAVERALSASSASKGRIGPQVSAELEDAVAALISIGYGEKDARKQVERAAREVDPQNLELLVRTALAG